MYRHFIIKIPSIYCSKWPCDRECGLLHLPLLKCQEVVKENDNGRVSTVTISDDFEDIMTRAGKKVSVSYVEPPMPPPLEIPEGSKNHKPANFPIDMTERSQLSPHADTTFLFFKSGIDTSRTDESATLYDDPPTTLETESTIDEVINRNTHDITMNPIFHDRIDSRIDSDDEFDYSRISGLPPKLERNNSMDSLTSSISSQRAKQWRRAHYEPSLDIV